MRARPTSSTQNGAGSADSTLPTVTTTRVASTTLRRCGPSPSRPIVGVASAPTSSVMVSDHWASASETWVATAIVGTSGAPSELTTATTMPRKTRTGTSGRLTVAPLGNIYARGHQVVSSHDDTPV